jgi:hypothetical protein
MRRIFWGFWRNGSSCVPYTTFRAVPILASNSRRYSYSKNDSPLSPIPGVAYSAYQWYGESPTPCITDTRSRQLPASLIRGVGITDTESRLLNFLKKTLCIDGVESRWLPPPVIQWVADSLYRWVGESPTPCITDTESRWLCVSLSRGVDDSVDRWYGSRYSKKKIIWCRFSALLPAKPCL